MAFDQTYPAPPGNKRHSIIDISGPASYVQIAVATPPTGGQQVAAAVFGLTQIEWSQSMGSDDGQFDIVIFGQPLQKNKPLAFITLMWIIAATGAQVAGAVNLSARTARIFAIGL